MATAEARASLVERLAAYGDDPVGFVLDVFGPGYEKRHGAPLVLDPWQIEALTALSTCPDGKVRFAYAASKNALKTSTLALGGWWWLTTRVDAQIVCVSVSSDQLKLGLWKEAAMWFGLSPDLQSLFDFNTEMISWKEPEHKPTWWWAARSWPKDADQAAQKETLAGLHGPAMMFVGDEASGIPDGIVAAADAIFASEGGEARLVLAGNTVRQAGPLYRSVMNKQNQFWVKRISGDPDDPKRCSRVSIKWAQDQLAQVGGDKTHPHYKINVLGEFPDVSSDKLLGPDDVDRAMVRNPQREAYEYEPVIIGIDTALQGTDETVLIKRQGCVAFKPRVWRTTNVMTLADQIAGELEKAKPDGVFIDLGGPSGHGVRDRLLGLGFRVTGIDFGEQPIGNDPTAPVFANRRAEMGWKCAQWVKKWGSLPDDQLLRAELLEPEFWPAETGKTRWYIEPKAEIKARLNRSPDRCDALWLTFAATVTKDLGRPVVTPPPRDFNPWDVLGGRA